ncbi:MAG: aldehyde dehydrogenase [Sphingobium sp.]
MPNIDLQHPHEFYIDGQWVQPTGQRRFTVIDCSTEEVAATVAEAESADIERAAAAARRAFDQGPWPRLSHAERAAYMRAIAKEFEARNDEFARGWAIESGILYKSAQARIGSYLSGAFTQYADMAESYPFIESRPSATGNQGFLIREPVGVVAVIVPWNGPAALIAYKVAPALLAGCTVIVKACPEAPTSALMFAEICEKVGLPAGVVNVVTADREVSAELVANPGVDKVTFTGSTAAGRKIFAACGERIARVTLELGGKSPALVLDDYDVETAANTLAGSYFGNLTGQVCHSLTRIIVPDAKHDAMVEALSTFGQSLKIGNSFDPESQVGPLASARQRDTVQGYVETAKAEGARLATGGKRPAGLDRGFFFEPTVFADVDNRMRIAQEEVFGPVLSVIRARDEQHAIDMANDTIFGLNASVFTNDPDRFLRVSRQIRAGTVGHNGPRTDFSLGFGGFKQSGIGREGGTDGLLPFLEEKTVVMDQPFQPA